MASTTLASTTFLRIPSPSIRFPLHSNFSAISKIYPTHGIYAPLLCHPNRKSFKLTWVYNNISTNFMKQKSNSPGNLKYSSNSNVVWDSMNLLEWPKLCEAVAAFAGTSLGKQALKEQLCCLYLSGEQSEILLSETCAGIELLKFSGNLDFSSLMTVEVKSAIVRLGEGLVIDGKEALAIAALLQFSYELKNTVKIALKDDAEWYIRFMPLNVMINDMLINQAVVQMIQQLVDEEGLLKDDASSDLKRARNQVHILEQRLYELMNNMLCNGRDETSSQEISYIDGRWCIRSAMEQPTNLHGLLLWSSSGVEKYVEPVAAVPLNDELARARAFVSKAEHDVLANLTEKVLPLLDQIELLLYSIVQLDVIISRAKYSLTFGGSKPILSFIDTDRISTSEQSDTENCHGLDGNLSAHGDLWLLHLRKVYHPLLLRRHRASIQNIKNKISATTQQLQRTRVQERNAASQERLESHLKCLERKLAQIEADCPVPVDILVRRKTKVLVITGPNTGGKTAAIKMVGLAALMAKYGLYVLAKDPVTIPCFDFVLADIGDEQSLSQSLSTFSGHLQQIKRIQAHSTGGSLVLLDEVGAGTNPLEGAALGMSVLESFSGSGSLLTVATTHQGELKTLKYSNDRFENASVEFDEENLKPTYKILWGIPGRSNALNIAERLGLPAHIIDNARKCYGKTSAEINKVIIDLERAKRGLKEYLQSTEYYLMQSKKCYQRLVAVKKKVADHSALHQYRKVEEISAAAANARSSLHRILRNIRESGGNISVSAAHTLEKEKINVPDESSTNHLSGKTSTVPKNRQGQTRLVPIIGQMLYVPSIGKQAKVLQVDEKKNEIVVEFGDWKLKLSLSELRTS